MYSSLNYNLHPHQHPSPIIYWYPAPLSLPIHPTDSYFYSYPVPSPIEVSTRPTESLTGPEDNSKALKVQRRREVRRLPRDRARKERMDNWSEK